MNEKEFSLQEEDKEKIKSAVKFHNPMEITSYTLPKNMEVYIQEVLGEFLMECHQEHMIDYLKFCVDELLNNSKKANTKRIYFKEKNLDINDEQDYNEGMMFFKDETLLNIDHYLEEQKKAGLYIKLILKKEEDFIKIEVRNNCALTKFEKDRIDEKIDLAMHYSNISDVFANVLDQTEGAGLGIIIIILMLQKIGLSKDNYHIISNESETITRIELPLNKDIQNQINEVSKVFAQKQKSIPVFDSSFEQLQNLLNDPSVTETQITDFFTKEPTCAFLLLSESCKEHKDCACVIRAVKLLGLDKIRQIFTPDNEKIRIIPVTEQLKKLWKHDYHVAFIAYNLIENFPPKSSLAKENLFTIALIHNIENLLIAVTTPEEKAEVMQECLDRDIPEAVVELFYTENCFYKYDNLISERWGQSPLVNAAFSYLYNKETSEAIKEIVNYIYFADIIQCYKEKSVDYYQINRNILDTFGIDSESKLLYIIKQIDSILKD